MAAQPIYSQQAYPVQKSRVEIWTYKVGAFFLKYWALLIAIILGVIMLAAVSVPFLAYFGLDSISKPIFFALHMICAQIPSHSFYALGHQFGMCARNISIYGSMFAYALIFVLSKKRLPGMPWWVWLLMILPMAYDGLTQMFGLRESTWELRVLTGTLFGVANMWFALPLIQRILDSSMPVHNAAQIPSLQPVMPVSPDQNTLPVAEQQGL